MGTTAEKLAYLADTKTAIKDAIISNGIDVPDDTTFRVYPDKVNQIIGQFDSTLDEIIGGEIIPMLDVQDRLETINGITGDVSTQLDTLDATNQDLATAITEKGMQIPQGTPFGDYADLIALIQTGLSDGDLAKATATVEDVTAGKTFYAGNRELKTGTASKGFVLTQEFTGGIASGSTKSFITNSKNVIIFGTPNSGASWSSINVYIYNGKIVSEFWLDYNGFSFSEYGNGLSINFSPTKNLTFANNSYHAAETPLYIFEG